MYKKKKFLTVVAVIVGVVMFFACSQKSTQNDGKNTQNNGKNIQNNGTLEIVSVHIPDSIVFKLSAGVEIEAWKLGVSLVSESKTLQTVKLRISGGVFTNKDGKAVLTCNDQTMFYVTNIDIPSDFIVREIKFVIDKTEMYYNLAKSKWE